MAIIAGYLQNGSYPAAADRRVMAAWADRSAPSIVRDGVLWSPGDPMRAAPGIGWEVEISPGRAIVGGYVVDIDAPEVVSVQAAGSATRVDLVGVVVRDEEAGDDESAAALHVVRGGQVAPDRFLPLASVTVRALSESLTSGDIADRRTFTAPVGGVVRARSASAGLPSNLPNGSLVARESDGELFRVLGGQLVGVERAGHTHWSAPVMPTLGSGFTVRNNYAPPAVRTDGRLIAITGVIDAAANSTGTIFTLPVEMRPTETRYYTTVANDNMRTVQIAAAGGVSIRPPGSGAGWVNLTGVFPL